MSSYSFSAARRARRRRLAQKEFAALPIQPQHVVANIALEHELNAEYRNRGQRIRLPWRKYCGSSASRMRFTDHASEYYWWNEYRAALANIGPWWPSFCRIEFPMQLTFDL